jgi:hypothetical protein
LAAQNARPAPTAQLTNSAASKYQTKRPSSTVSLAWKHDYQSRADPKLNAVLIDHALCEIDRHSIVRACQRLIAIEMSVVPDEVRPIFFHPSVPYG